MAAWNFQPVTRAELSKIFCKTVLSMCCVSAAGGRIVLLHSSLCDITPTEFAMKMDMEKQVA